jgi:hypothetical protein
MRGYKIFLKILLPICPNGNDEFFFPLKIEDILLSTLQPFQKEKHLPSRLVGNPVGFKRDIIAVNKLLILFIFVILGLKQSTAQTIYAPPNINFEAGNFSGWYLFTGVCCPINTPNAIGAILGRHTITSVGEVDKYGRFPIVAPEGGSFSLKLGNENAHSEAERARYFLKIPKDINNYSLILRYAVVLNDGGHTSGKQPRFEVKGYDSATGAPLSCVQFNFVAYPDLKFQS